MNENIFQSIQHLVDFWDLVVETFPRRFSKKKGMFLMQRFPCEATILSYLQAQILWWNFTPNKHLDNFKEVPQRIVAVDLKQILKKFIALPKLQHLENFGTAFEFTIFMKACITFNTRFFEVPNKSFQILSKLIDPKFWSMMVWLIIMAIKYHPSKLVTVESTTLI